MEGLADVGQVLAITVICFAAGLIIQNCPLDNKWIPSICAVLGGILGVVGLKTMPDFPAHDYMTAIAVGISSGLAATGIHQAYRQLKPSDKGRVTVLAEPQDPDKTEISRVGFVAQEDKE